MQISKLTQLVGFLNELKNYLKTISESKVTKDKNGENILYLEITVVIVDKEYSEHNEKMFSVMGSGITLKSNEIEDILKVCKK